MADSIKAVIEAVTKVIEGVDVLAKDKKGHQYKYASIDDFLSLVNPLCAEHGLVIAQSEVDCHLSDTKPVQVSMRFEFTVMHTSGERLPPMVRTIAVPASNAQAYGSAQSYALKQFMRSLFLIPTGDKDDADMGKSQKIEKVAPQQAAAKPDMKKQANSLKKKLEGCKDKQELAEMWDTNIDLLNDILSVSKTAHEALSKLYEELEADFDTQEAQT